MGLSLLDSPSCPRFLTSATSRRRPSKPKVFPRFRNNTRREQAARHYLANVTRSRAKTVYDNAHAPCTSGQGLGRPLTSNDHSWLRNVVELQNGTEVSPESRRVRVRAISHTDVR